MHTKKTVLSDEARNQTTALLTTKYKGFLNDRFITMSDYYDDEGSYLELKISNNDDSYSYEIAARMHKEQISTPEKAVMKLLDGIDSYLNEFFESGESINLPIEYSEYEIGDKFFQLRGQIFNRKLEKMADQLLGSINSDDLN